MDSSKFSSPGEPGWWRKRETPNRHLYLLDGDLYALHPGLDFHTDIATFRTKLSYMTKKRGLRYRSVVRDGVLWVEVYRNTPGDLADENPDLTLPDGPQDRADAPLEP
jgi:hypothetical protein